MRSVLQAAETLKALSPLPVRRLQPDSRLDAAHGAAAAALN
jgi:hypothetical protein